MKLPKRNPALTRAAAESRRRPFIVNAPKVLDVKVTNWAAFGFYSKGK